MPRIKKLEQEKNRLERSLLRDSQLERKKEPGAWFKKVLYWKNILRSNIYLLKKRKSY